MNYFSKLVSMIGDSQIREYISMLIDGVRAIDGIILLTVAVAALFTVARFITRIRWSWRKMMPMLRALGEWIDAEAEWDGGNAKGVAIGSIITAPLWLPVDLTLGNIIGAIRGLYLAPKKKKGDDSKVTPEAVGGIVVEKIKALKLGSLLTGGGWKSDIRKAREEAEREIAAKLDAMSRRFESLELAHNTVALKASKLERALADAELVANDDGDLAEAPTQEIDLSDIDLIDDIDEPAAQPDRQYLTLGLP